MPEFVQFMTMEDERISIHWNTIETIIEKRDWTEVHTSSDVHFTKTPYDTIQELITKARRAGLEDEIYERDSE